MGKGETPRRLEYFVNMSIYKKNDPQDCKNYKGIALMNVACKILAYCILDKIKPIAESVLGEYQEGLRPN